MPIPPPIPILLHPATTHAAARASSSLLAAALVHNLYSRLPEWVREDEAWKSLLRSTDASGTSANATSGGHVDEMASLASVIAKLEGLLGTGWGVLGSQRRRMRRRRTAGSSSRLYEDSSCRSNMSRSCQSQPSSGTVTMMEEELSISPLEWHAALLAYVQISNQMRERHPGWRDEMYHSAYQNNGCDSKGQIYTETLDNSTSEEPIDNETFQSELPTGADEISTIRNHKQTISTQEITTLQRMLDYAVWAYEPNEDILRHLLLLDKHETNHESETKQDTTGYQLLVHRTTSYIEPSSNSNTSSSKKNVKKMRKPPGRVGYYVAISHEKCELLIGMKGTSTLEEILTDCCGRALRLELDGDPHHPVVRTDDIDICGGSNSRDESVDEENVNETTNLETGNDELSVDEVLQVSFISHGNDASQPDEIEVNLVDIDVFHQDESIETSINLLHQAEMNENADSSFDAMKKSREEVRKRKGSSVDLSTVSAPNPAENVLLIPAEQVSRSVMRRSENKSQSTILESCHGIEMQPQRTTKVRGVHEGLIHCAQQLFSEISPLIEEYAVSKGYDVICTGHSMGAGTSALLALLIRGKYPELVNPRIRDSDSKIMDGNIPVERVRAYAFASPPVMDRASALACQHYVTSIVNNSDIIPRSSLTNLDVLLTMLEAVRHRLVDRGLNPGLSKATKGSSDMLQRPKNFITSLVALFHKLSEGSEGDLLIDLSELNQVWNDAVADACLGEDEILWDEEGDHHLFVPGSVLVLYEPWSSKESPTPICVNEEDNSDQQPQQDAATSSPYNIIWTDGTATMLKGIEVGAGGNMVSDHLTTSYYRALDALKNTQTPTT